MISKTKHFQFEKTREENILLFKSRGTFSYSGKTETQRTYFSLNQKGFGLVSKTKHFQFEKTREEKLRLFKSRETLLLEISKIKHY